MSVSIACSVFERACLIVKEKEVSQRKDEVDRGVGYPVCREYYAPKHQNTISSTIHDQDRDTGQYGWPPEAVGLKIQNSRPIEPNVTVVISCFQLDL